MALSGMTGFAREDGAHGAWSWTIEARSVNGRNLDVRFRGPPGFDSLERVAREGAQARFSRGQLTVGLTAKRAEASGQVRVNEAQLEHYISLSSKYAGPNAAPATIGQLLSLKGVLEASEEGDDAETRAEVEQAMALSIERALDGLKTARQEEGIALAPVLNGLVERIETLVQQAEIEAAAQPALVRERFEKRLADLLADRKDMEDRIVQEAAVLAAKADVREELDRLGTHIDAARTLFASDQAAGRRLDFLAQEFMREANTLCSKSAASPLTTVGLELKAVIEQLREQVQNVE
jgi:uncharacterized protein (TIGR00255 family)